MNPYQDEPTLPPAPTISLPGGSSPIGPPPSAAPPGYVLLEEVGRGGMGVVYKARHVELKRLVALKMILAGSHAGSELLARFHSEAEAVARLTHPNIVQIFEVGTHADVHGARHPFMALEFIDGPPLSKLLAESPLPPTAAARLVLQLADAMQAAHLQGVIHRDLKPANVLLASAAPQTADNAAADLVPKITDFGLAKRLDMDSQQTHTGAILGTPSYMPPEQAEGRTITPLVDVYALGAILYECLTGRPPFKAATPLDTVMQVVTTEPVPPRRLQPQTPLELETICLKCLEKAPARRYASAAELAEDLRRFLAHEPIHARPIGVLGRHRKWVQRQPVMAVLAYTCLAIFILALHEWHEATKARALAETRQFELAQERDVAHEQRQLAEQETLRARRFFYAADMKLAQQALASHQGQRLRAILDRQIPRPGQFDLRSFEWHYLLGPTRTATRRTSFEPGLSLDRLAASGNGRWLALLVSGRRNGGRYSEVRLLDAHDCRELYRWPVGGVGLAFSPDNTMLACCADNGDVIVGRLADGETLLRLPMPGVNVSQIVFVPGGDGLCVVGGPDRPRNDQDMAAMRNLQADRTVRFFSLKGETRPLPLRTPDNSFYGACVGFSPDGTHLVIGGAGSSGPPAGRRQSGGIVALFAWPSGNLIRVHGGLPAVVLRVHFSPDSTSYAAASGKHLLVWERETGAERLREAAHADAVHASDMASAKPLLVTADLAGGTALWDLSHGRRLYTGFGHEGGIHAAVFRPDGQAFITAGSDGQMVWWSTAPQNSDRELLSGPVVTAPRFISQAVAFSRDGRTLATVEHNDIVLWDTSTWTKQSAFRISQQTMGLVAERILWSPDGSALVVATEDGPGSVWSIQGRKLAVLKLIEQDADALHFNAAGTHLVGRRLRWRLADWSHEELPTRGPTPRIYSPDGKLALAWEKDRLFSEDGTQTQPMTGADLGTAQVLLFEPETGHILFRWKLQSRLLSRAAFSPRGDLVAIGGVDGGLWVFDIRSGALACSPRGHLRILWSLDFSPDGQTLAASSIDGSVRLWDPYIGQERLEFKNEPLVGGCLRFSPDGRVLAVGWGQNPLNPIRPGTTLIYQAR